MKTGVYRGLSRAAYEKVDAAHYSLLKWYDRSAAHARHYFLEPPDQTPAMYLGEVLHAAVLEPDSFEARYVAAPALDKRTKEGKAGWAAFKASFPNHQLVDADDMVKALGMRDAVWEHPYARELLGSAGGTEVGAFWEDQATGAPCKALIDRVGRVADRTIICDLKSCQDARPYAFQKDVMNYRYHAQCSFYVEGLAAIDGRDRGWRWIAVESKPPYGVMVYQPNMDVMNLGERLWRRWLEQHEECKKSGVWPGYGVETHVLELPAWAMREE